MSNQPLPPPPPPPLPPDPSKRRSPISGVAMVFFVLAFFFGFAGISYYMQYDPVKDYDNDSVWGGGLELFFAKVFFVIAGLFALIGWVVQTVRRKH